MKRFIFILIIINLSINCYSFWKPNTKLSSSDVIRKEDFTIGGITLGKSVSKTLKILGKARKIEKGDKNDQNDKYYFYEGVTISTLKDKPILVSGIFVEKSGMYTYRGIEVGDTQQKVIEKYGYTKKVDNRLFYELELDTNYDYAMNFLIHKGKVKAISIYLAPTY